MKARVTQSDIARVAGVHNTTVSLALRNSRLIPDDTRKRIQAIAGELGYFPDPALRALVAYRNSRRTKREQGTLAYVTNWETKWGWQQVPSEARFFAGAQRKATEFGYQLENLWLGEPGMSPRRLASMLQHRGITGVLLAAHRRAHEDLPGIDWSHFSVVQLGGCALLPSITRVTEDHLERVRLAVRQLQRAGLNRIGFVLCREWDLHVGQAWSMAYFAQHSFISSRDRVPIFPVGETAPHNSTRLDGALALKDWYLEHRPEAILGLGPALVQRLEQAGVSVPEDTAYVDLDLLKPGGQIAGVEGNCERVGELGVELLGAQLARNDFGPPAIPTQTSVGGAWHAGDSFPQLTVADASMKCA